MATTAPELAEPILQTLSDLRVPYALMHNEASVARGVIDSDVDIVAAEPASVLLVLLSPMFDRIGLQVIARFPYDVGAETLFVADRSADRGIQLDVVCDVGGHGRLGLRTGPLLASATCGTRWPVLSTVDSVIYQLRKRLIKDDRPRIEVQAQLARALGPSAVRNRAAVVCTPRAARSVSILLDSERPGRLFRHSPIADARSLWRLASRVVRPVGHWFEISGPGARSAAEEAANRLNRILPVAVARVRPEGLLAQPAWWATTVAPVRWRPHLILTVAGSRSLMRPDGRISASSPDRLMPELTAAMSGRVAGRRRRRRYEERG